MPGRATNVLAERLRAFTTTIFSEMSELALATGSLNLGQGFPDTDGPPELVRVATEAIAAGRNQYPPSQGVPELRAAVAAHQASWYGLALSPEHEVLVTTGATEAIAATFLALCEPGDEVVMFEPSYDSYAACASMAGAVPRLVRLHAPDWSFDPGELAAAIGPRTRLLLLNSPHNPTGKVFGPDELGQIAELCCAHDILAVTDEVYEHLVFDGVHVPLATLPGMAERTLSISSGGKTFSFTGWKVGWASGPAPLVAAVRAAKQFLTYTSGAPFQLAIAHGLGFEPRRHQQFGRGVAGQARPVLRRLGKARLHRAPPGRDVLRHHRHRERGPRHGCVRLLPRPAGTLRCGGDPQFSVLRPRRPRRGADPRPLGLLQARRGVGRGARTTRLVELIAAPARRPSASPAHLVLALPPQRNPPLA